MEVLLLLLVAGILFLMVSLLIPAKYLFTGSLLTSVFQIYTVSIFGIYPSFTLLSGLSLWPGINHHSQALRFKPIRLFIALLIVHGLSLLWSTDVRLGIRTIFYLLPFITIFMVSYALSRKDSNYTYLLLIIFVLLACTQAVLVVLFFISPDLETAFLRSPIANIFITPNSLDILFGSGHNNVLDPAKSGGFFLNGNTASAFLGMSTLLCWGLSVAKKNGQLLIIAFFLGISVLFTGSKTGFILILITTLLVYFAYYYMFSRRNHGQTALLLISIAIIFIGIRTILSHLAVSGFITNSEETLNLRYLFWDHGLKDFFAHPFLGLGFGGWEKSIGPYAISLGFTGPVPPHNTLVYLWSQSGIMAVVIGAAFIGSVIVFCLKVIATKNRELQILGLITTATFLWVFIHGMGDNSGIVGELHIQPVLATILGLTYAKYMDHFPLPVTEN